MARIALLLSLLFTRGIWAEYDQFFFASQSSNWTCGDLGYKCPPPRACVHDTTLDKFYCCTNGDADGICWSGATDCGANNQPEGNQIGCSSGENAFCCLANREECTQTYNQINICWATANTNPFANFSDKVMNETFSSISSARPQASTLSFNPQRLLSTSVSSATATADPATTPTDAPSPSTSSNSDSDSGLSGGAIGGIVVGVVGGLAIIGLGAFFFWRRGNKKIAPGNELDGTSNPYAGQGYGAVPHNMQQEKYAQHGQGVVPGQQYYPPAEMDANAHAPVEVEGSGPVANVQPTR
ncbi:hypothetical protein EJ04DRAFT_529124 [Polyplosphaeria fusca]|uniref:Uncharacterized protein n=1 Tax=Polyplosphaeria fusca TaxID=682080 RepID=A0A9P4UTG9_9PLEO|nr:hypothetical protein EJ04DRAFT_529124 [Polyplosphaeria fusca]